MIPLDKVKDILDRHAKLEVNLSSADIDKNNLLKCQKNIQI